MSTVRYLNNFFFLLNLYFFNANCMHMYQYHKHLSKCFILSYTYEYK